MIKLSWKRDFCKLIVLVCILVLGTHSETVQTANSTMGS